MPSRDAYDRIAWVQTPNRHTVIVELKRPYAPIVPNFFGGDSNYATCSPFARGLYESLVTRRITLRQSDRVPTALRAGLAAIVSTLPQTYGIMGGGQRFAALASVWSRTHPQS